jgi:hypothetical protein
MESYFQFRQNMKSHVNAIARANPVAPTVFGQRLARHAAVKSGLRQKYQLTLVFHFQYSAAGWTAAPCWISPIRERKL